MRDKNFLTPPPIPEAFLKKSVGPERGSDNPILIASRIEKRFVLSKKSAPIFVLRGVDCEVQEGELIGIVGKSGAGKSTLLHILGTLEEPTAGELKFNGENLFEWSEERLSQFRNQMIGFVFQFHYLMIEFTALENVMMPALLARISKKNATEYASYLLDRVGLSHRMSHKPNQLSGGEQQRVAIARALMRRPRLLLTDEMTGNLDPETGHQVFDLMEGLHEEFKMAIVSVTHDASRLSFYQKIWRLEEGHLVTEKGGG